MQGNLTKKYFGIALILSLLICLTINFPFILSALFDDIDRGHTEGHRTEYFDVTMAIMEVFVNFLVAYLMFTLNFFVIRPFERHRKLKFQTVIISLLLSILSVSVLVLIFNSIKPTIGFVINPRSHHDELMLKNFFSLALVLGSVFLMRLIYQKQTYELENEKLTTESLQSQFESLKNQVSPHFLFNSLTAMKTLIQESPDLAGQYVDHLSQVLRYTLQSNEKKTVTLSEEMEFADSYLFLIKMRYDTNLIVKTEVDERLKGLLLPPLTVQTLLENVVKHNEISKRNPLTIVIQTIENEILVVRNRIQEKLTPEEGTGIGLTNLAKQFQLLGEREIQISQENNEFRVEVPLIRPKSI
ncbi:MAG: histidine kinase [Mariniphaga sp.]|nr:histidine kinase [Mariniphaga sp.]